MGCGAMRGSSISGAASAASGSANREAAYNAPREDAPARKFRRENEFANLFIGISKNLLEAYWFHSCRAINFSGLSSTGFSLWNLVLAKTKPTG
jgi:hypothetical protein